MRKFALDWLTLYVSFSKKIHQLFEKNWSIFFTAVKLWKKSTNLAILRWWHFRISELRDLQITGMKMVTAWKSPGKAEKFQIGEKKLPFFGSLQETPKQGVPSFPPSLGRISRCPHRPASSLRGMASRLCFRYPTSSVVEVWKWWGGEDMKNLELY